MKVRNLYPGERVPRDLNIGFAQEQQGQLTPDLVWVIEHQWNVVGVLLGSAAHGFFLPIRVAVSEVAPKSALLVLLRSAFADMRKRGCTSFLTLLEPDKFGQAVSKVVTRRGGIAFPGNGAAYLGGKIADVA